MQSLMVRLVLASSVALSSENVHPRRPAVVNWLSAQGVTVLVLASEAEAQRSGCVTKGIIAGGAVQFVRR